MASFRTREPWLPPKTRSEATAALSFAGRAAKPPRTGLPVEHTLRPVEGLRVLPGTRGRPHERTQHAVREAGDRVGLEDHRVHSEKRGHQDDGTAGVAAHPEDRLRPQAPEEEDRPKKAPGQGEQPQEQPRERPPR